MLTDFQKAAFLTECVVQVEEKYNTTIELNGWDYVTALNIFVDKCNSGICENPLMSEALETMLIGDGKVPVLR